MIKVMLIALFLTFSSYAETIKYEIYNATTDKLISKGEKIYSHKDILEHPYRRKNQEINEKMLELEQGYKIGARIFEEPKLTGFGLIARRNPSDFSWEWYDKDTNYIFKKLQGGTYVEVRFGGGPLFEILQEIYFLDDTTLEFETRCKKKKQRYKIIIKKGSILKFD